MIDSTTSPMPVWKRYATIALLAVLIVVAAFVVYTKELHHSSATTPPAPASLPKPAQPAPSVKQSSTATTIPGGVPISSRNPFQ